MNAPSIPAPQSSSQPSPHPGRPPVLGPSERQRLLDLLAAGCSRRVAAMQVGCAPSTISRTAARDPAFAADIVRAESSLETQLLGSICQAAKSDRHWRTAAWLLRRRNVQDFARRSADFLSPDQVLELFAATLDSLREKLSQADRDSAVQELDLLLLEFDPHAPRGKRASPQSAP